MHDVICPVLQPFRVLEVCLIAASPTASSTLAGIRMLGPVYN